jgi:hypothetical protein
MKTAAPTFKMVGRTTIQKDVLKMFQHERSIFKTVLEDNESKYSFTIDAWTSRTNLAFMSVTIHWITDTWDLKEQTLDFSKLKGSHTGANLANVFNSVLEDFNISPQRFLSMTTDNASNNKTMMEELKLKFEMKGVSICPEQNWIPCVAHTINLAVQEALSHLNILPTEEITADDDDDLPVKNLSAVGKLRRLIVKVHFKSFSAVKNLTASFFLRRQLYLGSSVAANA